MARAGRDGIRHTPTARDPRAVTNRRLTLMALLWSCARRRDPGLVRTVQHTADSRAPRKRAPAIPGNVVEEGSRCWQTHPGACDAPDRTPSRGFIRGRRARRPVARMRSGPCSSAWPSTAMRGRATRSSSATCRWPARWRGAMGARATRSTTSSRWPRSGCSRRSTASTPTATSRSPPTPYPRSWARSSVTSATTRGRCGCRATCRSARCSSIARSAGSRRTYAASPR